MSVEYEGETSQTRTRPPGDGVPLTRARTLLPVLRVHIATHFLSLRAKVVALLTVVGMVLVAMSGVYVVTMFNQNLAHEADLRAGAAGDVLTHAARHARSPEELETILAAVGNAPGIAEVAVAGHDGKIAAASHAEWQGKRVAAAAAAFAGTRAETKRPVAIEPQTHLAGGSAYGGDYAVWLDLAPAGMHAVAIVRVDMDRLVARLTAKAWDTMTWLTITAILAILTISMLIHRIVVVPIEALRDYAQDNRRGEAATSEQGDEIGIVARALTASFQATRDGEARLANIAVTDGLTGLGNRGFFKTQLVEAIAGAERRGGFVGVMILNLGNFKDINDTLGHDSGDLVLQRTADILKGCQREGDVVARIGGDEFGIVLNGVRSADEALELASRLVRAVGAPFRLGAQELQQASCVGMTLFPQDGRDAEVLMKNADLALSRAKQEGAGACVLYRHELHLRAIERNQIERDLRVAVARRELKLYYQPKVDVATGRITGAEALIRWQHEERGFIPPSVFIPVAERSGIVVELTKWVLDEACRQNRAWQDDGMPRIAIAVNVSAIDLRRTDLTDTIANTLIARGLSPQYLELEVTESMVMQDVDTVIGTLRRLRSLGIGIGIDDFGTGYSSLAYLKRFPVKRLKIDRSFVNDIADRRDGHVIPKVIIDLAHALGVSVVAEGVESADQFDMLRELGCDEVQGYFLGRPMPAAEFEIFLRNSPAGGLRPAIAAGSAA
ncbi:putative bifunctional diguanylate cyclase/phosphodiesterase [Parvibaculum sp.]|uniref:putative bifunctional diguanylate cyclase/phosphodiesterase n=1 Tax=Parvibaculum sp. TaxID=2024848 RepID=UPI00349FF779